MISNSAIFLTPGKWCSVKENVKMISRILKLSEYHISQFILTRKYVSADEIKLDYLRHDWTRYSFQFYLHKSPFEELYLERLKQLGMCSANSTLFSPWVTPSIFEPLYRGNSLPDNFYPFGFGEIITPDVHLYSVQITSMVSLKLDGEDDEFITGFIAGNCLMDNKRFCK